MQTAIYSKTDGIVDWHNCINEDPAFNFEVKSTHGGMAFNVEVYRLLALRLHEASNGKPEPAGKPDSASPKPPTNPAFDFARWRNPT